MALKLYGPPPSCGELNYPADDYADALDEMKECTFEEFVKSLVRHSYGSERQCSWYRGVHHAGEGRWEARIGDRDV
jgi:hypothetical protein